MIDLTLFNSLLMFNRVVLLLFIVQFGTVYGCTAGIQNREELVINQIIKNEIKEFYDIPYYTGKEADSIKHKLNLFIPRTVDNPPIVLWIHGGAWAFGGRKFETDLARSFAKEGIAVAAISYRHSPATWKNPKWNSGVQHPEHIKDVAKAFSWVYDNAASYGYDKHSIFVSGFSAGAHLSALLAMDPRYLTNEGRSIREIRAAIPIAGAYDLVAYYNSHLRYNGKGMADSHVKGVFGNSMEGINNASPTKYMDNQWVPQLVISERETYDYTLLYENEAKKADYRTMEFHHVKNRNHNGLYQDLKNNESQNKKLIIDYIKNNRANYRYLNRDGFKLAYKIFGNGEPVFLLNGGPGFSSHNFQSLAGKIAKEAQKQVVLFDQRGTGYSELLTPNPSNISLNLMVDDLEALREYLNFDQISLMGQSFGGIYAMAYTAKYPENVDKIVLSHSAGMNMEFMQDVDERLNNSLSSQDHELLDKSMSENNPDISSKLRYKALSSGYVFNKENKEKVYRGLAFNSKFYPEINRLMWQDMRSNYNVVNAMKSIKSPVLIIHGDNDIVNPKHARHTHMTIPNSKLVLLENCVHYGWIDNPEVYFREVLSFLKTS
ncbi:alpha/beta fold hydrolase [Flagellimonas hymeniacidonis]|uniref:Alpha/beta fold hydrolase n=1 Tax=Flagellimonas hymeniacidonis TaxID=2603628 RepID=A0A5C8V9E8_9FLAO|nr:alpha/beta hydrolase [Flagellimonas hymeniacidonis]TXN38297.1 alpha/beta fold hydrolase [Flagellimonas hymeniacidonis]